MAFNEYDPTTWTIPGFHPDTGIDSARHIEMLRECCIELHSVIPCLTTRLVFEEEGGILYCEIREKERMSAELFCIQSLRDDSVRFGVLTENTNATWEYEFYTDNIDGVCQIVARIRDKDDLQSLQEEYGSSK